MRELDSELFERLQNGDRTAAEELFAIYGPYLRAVVRGQLSDRLQAKLDPTDVVQSVWVQVVRKLRDDGWQVRNEGELKALLATIARRRAISRARHYASALHHEHAGIEELDAFAEADQPRPSEFVQADDLWEKLLKLCPPNHHVILQLRREGLTMGEIAERTGMHEGSVRRVLRRLARELALAEFPIPHSDETDAPIAE